MTTHERYQEALDEVANLRDAARLQTHLFSLDVQERWKDVENALDSARLEGKTESEEATELALLTLKKAVKLGRRLLEESAETSRVLETPSSKVMTRQPRSCAPYDSLNRPARLMWDANCGSIPVVDNNGILTGIVTDRDIAMATYSKGRPLEGIEVHEVMSHGVVVANENSTLREVLGVMSTHQLHRVPIVDSKGHLLGIVAISDISRYVAENDEYSACLSIVRTLAAIASPQASA